MYYPPIKARREVILCDVGCEVLSVWFVDEEVRWLCWLPTQRYLRTEYVVTSDNQTSLVSSKKKKSIHSMSPADPAQKITPSRSDPICNLGGHLGDRPVCAR